MNLDLIGFRGKDDVIEKIPLEWERLGPIWDETWAEAMAEGAPLDDDGLVARYFKIRQTSRGFRNAPVAMVILAAIRQARDSGLCRYHKGSRKTGEPAGWRPL
mgnify:FL=1